MASNPVGTGFKCQVVLWRSVEAQQQENKTNSSSDSVSALSHVKFAKVLRQVVRRRKESAQLCLATGVAEIPSSASNNRGSHSGGDRVAAGGDVGVSGGGSSSLANVVRKGFLGHSLWKAYRISVAEEDSSSAAVTLVNRGVPISTEKELEAILLSSSCGEEEENARRPPLILVLDVTNEINDNKDDGNRMEGARRRSGASGMNWVINGGRGRQALCPSSSEESSSGDGLISVSYALVHPVLVRDETAAEAEELPQGSLPLPSINYGPERNSSSCCSPMVDESSTVVFGRSYGLDVLVKEVAFKIGMYPKYGA